MNYILRRLPFAVLVVVVVTFLAFVLVYLSGDPARAMAGADTTEETLIRIRQDYGLDRPLYEQYWLFVTGAIHGDLGRSFHFQTDVLLLVLDKFFITLQLAIASLIVSIVVAVPLGIISSTRQGQLVD